MKPRKMYVLYMWGEEVNREIIFQISRQRTSHTVNYNIFQSHKSNLKYIYSHKDFCINMQYQIEDKDQIQMLLG